MANKKTRIGFVGVGRMGANMARRLVDSGYPLTAIFDNNKEATRKLASELGAKTVPKLSDVTKMPMSS
jgi:3-hydroxyisobutyrate dehydrogenase